MSFDGLLNPLRFDADVTLCCGGAGVLQQPLHQGDVISAVLVNLGGIPLPEAVSADALIAQVVTDDMKLLLDGSFCHRENGGSALDAVSQAVILDVLLDNKGNCERSELAGLLLGDVQTEAVTISHDIAESKLQDVTDPQSQVALQHQNGGDALIRTATGETLPHGLNDLLVLLCGQSLGLLVHDHLLESSYFLA